MSILGSAVLLLAVLLCGCGGPEQQVRKESPVNGLSSSSRQQTAVKPTLGTNEVLRIAVDSASRKGIRLDDYVCQGSVYGWPGFTNKWVVFFTRQPPVPDGSLFVIIEDSTRQVEVWRP